MAVGDVDGDGEVEVVTGGYFNDGTRQVAQLIEWNGATLAVDRLTSWYWTGDTMIKSLALGDVSGDGQVEVVTSRCSKDIPRYVAQLINGDGATLTVDRLTSWYWTGTTQIFSVISADVDGDGIVGVFTGGYFFDGSRTAAQLIEWNGATLTVDRLTSWYWTGTTQIFSVISADVDGDGIVEVVTGRYFNDGTRYVCSVD